MDLSVVNNVLSFHIRIEYLVVIVVIFVIMQVIKKGKS